MIKQSKMIQTQDDPSNMELGSQDNPTNMELGNQDDLWQVMMW